VLELCRVVGFRLGARRAILLALTLGGTKDLVKSMENRTPYQYGHCRALKTL
jgi:hypothetical protein